MRAVKMSILAVIGVVAMAAVGAGVAFAAAPLTLSVENLEGRPIAPGAHIEGAASVEGTFEINKQALSCKDFEGLQFGGEVVSSNEPKDKLEIKPRHNQILCEAVAPGIEALLFEENPELILSVSSKGTAKLGGGSENVKMVLEGFIGTKAFKCAFEKTSPFKGTNTATAKQAELGSVFSEERPASRLRFTEVGSTNAPPTCPARIKVGLSVQSLFRAPPQEEAILEEIT